jgi:biopolymer transport protein ExbD
MFEPGVAPAFIAAASAVVASYFALRKPKAVAEADDIKSKSEERRSAQEQLYIYYGGIEARVKALEAKLEAKEKEIEQLRADRDTYFRKYVMTYVALKEAKDKLGEEFRHDPDVERVRASMDL